MRWIIVCAALLNAQDIKPDTRALVSTLESQRHTPGLSPEAHRSIQASFREWADVRLRGRETVDDLNRELHAAGALDLRSEQSLPEHTLRNSTGYIEQVHEESAGPTLDAIRLGVGDTCAYDETVVLYRREPWALIGFLQSSKAADIQNGVSWAFSALQIREAKGRILVASAEFTKWCTSTLMTGHFRIDSIDGTGMRTLLTRELPIRRGMEGPESWDHPIRIEIYGDTVTFRYVKTLPGAHVAPAYERYSVVSGKAVRIGQ